MSTLTSLGETKAIKLFPNIEKMLLKENIVFRRNNKDNLSLYDMVFHHTINEFTKIKGKSLIKISTSNLSFTYFQLYLEEDGKVIEIPTIDDGHQILKILLESTDKTLILSRKIVNSKHLNDSTTIELSVFKVKL